jgi:hypothetical protein
MLKPLHIVAFTALCATPAAANPVDIQLFGSESTKAQHACFIRHYDQAHLKSHPDQNVTDMLLLVSSWDEEEGGSDAYGVAIGVEFRNVPNQLALSGFCGSGEDGTALNCGIECDGGTINVTVRDADSVRVEIPDGARTWDPESDEDPDPAAQFGSDDKVFRVNRTALKECLSLVWDDEVKARITAGE